MEPFLGQLLLVGFNFAPRGYAACGGQVLSIAQNSALFSLLGTSYGGNGQTTFSLPNLQGRVPVGQGQSGGTSFYTLGEMAGTENVTLNMLQMPAHNHVATTNPTTLPATGTATGNIAIPANNTSGGNPTPSPNRFLGTVQGGSTLYTGNSNTTLEPFSVTLPVTADVPIPANFVQTGVTGGSQPFPIIQPFQVLNYVIAINGVFPSRN